MPTMPTLPSGTARYWLEEGDPIGRGFSLR